MFKFKKIFIFSMVFVLFLASSNLLNASAASKVNADEEQQVRELAELLEFLFEEAVKKDSLGNVVIDKEKVMGKYGNEKGSEIIKEFDAFSPQNDNKNGISTMSAKVDACVNNLIIENYGWMALTSGINTVVEYVKAGEFTLAAKHLVKIGIKGSVQGIAVNLTAYLLYCIYTEEGWV